jgi:hypothetical protein
MMGLFSRNTRLPKFVLHNGTWHDSATLIADRWPMLADLASSGYEAYGRGAVSLAKASHGPDTQDVYLPAARPLFMESRDRPGPQLRRACARYRPEREIVILVRGARNDKALRNKKFGDYCGIVKPPPKKGAPRPIVALNHRTRVVASVILPLLIILSIVAKDHGFVVLVLSGPVTVILMAFMVMVIKGATIELPIKSDVFSRVRRAFTGR